MWQPRTITSGFRFPGFFMLDFPHHYILRLKRRQNTPDIILSPLLLEHFGLAQII
jgi:hypothetical protein